MNQATFGNHDLLTVGETWGATPEIAKLYSHPERHELSMVFQFEHIGLDQQPGKSKWDLKPIDIAELKTVLAKWQTELGNEGWNSLFWNNHDLPRMISRWGNDGEYRVQSAKMLAILLHMMKGTPYIYQGEEIGMTNTPITDISQAEDIETVNLYHERLAEGYTKEEILTSINAKGRDNARRPIAWDDSTNGGFTSGTPWLALNDNYKEINVEAALADPTSIFYTYQELVQLRKDHPIMVWGDFELVDTVAEVFSYYRTYEAERWLVVTNFSNEPQPFTIDDELVTTVICNDEPVTTLKELTLKPWQAFVVKVN
jgi:glucan 1,6-alpha-glucosidase